MKRAAIFGFALAAVAFLTGCPAGYNSIRQVENGYILTKDQAGAFRVHGELWHCKPMGNAAQMQCRKLASD
ncbi:MAG: hypothetical protein KC731_22795 [Myxococcales bacterium]|nr:hypothetical protein [Myxococcales bacterium]